MYYQLTFFIFSIKRCELECEKYQERLKNIDVNDEVPFGVSRRHHVKFVNFYIKKIVSYYRNELAAVSDSLITLSFGSNPFVSVHESGDHFHNKNSYNKGYKRYSHNKEDSYGKEYAYDKGYEKNYFNRNNFGDKNSFCTQNDFSEENKFQGSRYNCRNNYNNNNNIETKSSYNQSQSKFPPKYNYPM